MIWVTRRLSAEVVPAAAVVDPDCERFDVLEVVVAGERVFLDRHLFEVLFEPAGPRPMGLVDGCASMAALLAIGGADIGGRDG